MRKDTKDYINNLSKNNGNCLKIINKPSEWFTGREEEVEQVIECLYKKRMKNCMLIGPSGSGKTQIIYKVAEELKKEFVFVQLDLTAMMSKCVLVGMFEERALEVFSSISEDNSKDRVDGKIVLFIDEAHTIFTADKNEKAGTSGMANILKPYLSDGNLIIIGATTNEEYEEAKEKDKALVRRISPVYIDELPKKETINALKGFVEGEIEESLLPTIYEEASKIEGFHQPDVSLELADRCMARQKRTGEVVNKKMIKAIASAISERKKDGTDNISAGK